MKDIESKRKLLKSIYKGEVAIEELTREKFYEKKIIHVGTGGQLVNIVLYFRGVKQISEIEFVTETTNPPEDVMVWLEEVSYESFEERGAYESLPEKYKEALIDKEGKQHFEYSKLNDEDLRLIAKVGDNKIVYQIRG